jgi:hypothetical protein
LGSFRLTAPDCSGADIAGLAEWSKRSNDMINLKDRTRQATGTVTLGAGR